jgi:hypothetical protein
MESRTGLFEANLDSINSLTHCRCHICYLQQAQTKQSWQTCLSHPKSHLLLAVCVAIALPQNKAGLNIHQMTLGEYFQTPQSFLLRQKIAFRKEKLNSQTHLFYKNDFYSIV